MKDNDIKTERLLISPIADEELRSMIDSVPDIETKKAYNRMLVLSMENPDDRKWYAGWKVILKTTGETVGDISFNGPPDETSTVMINCRIYDGCEDNGYEEELISQMAEWALSQKNVYFVDAETEKGNEKYMEILKRSGFEYYTEGTEGPRYCFYEEGSSMIPVYMCLGTALGTGIGLLFDKLIITMCCGVLIGLLYGILTDSLCRKERDRMFKIKGIERNDTKE